VAGNTAVSLAFLGKRVIVVGMDIRKPGLNRVFNLARKMEGITNYLSDPDHADLFSMIQKSDISDNLDILPGGQIPPNPTELVARDVLDKAIALLKDRYDYIILDTAPIGMVTDTAIISRVADMCVYVCRADVTPKAGFNYINVLQREHKLSKLATVINGLDMSKKENTKETPHEKIRVAAVREYTYTDVVEHINLLAELSLRVQILPMVKEMKSFVPEFKSQNSKFSELDIKNQES
jgi:tyrosine-protein kinase Etk/Wzc